jgi:hypothetical protein
LRPVPSGALREVRCGLLQSSSPIDSSSSLVTPCRGSATRQRRPAAQSSARKSQGKILWSPPQMWRMGSGALNSKIMNRPRGQQLHTPGSSERPRRREDSNNGWAPNKAEAEWKRSNCIRRVSQSMQHQRGNSRRGGTGSPVQPSFSQNISFQAQQGTAYAQGSESHGHTAFQGSDTRRQPARAHRPRTKGGCRPGASAPQPLSSPPCVRLLSQVGLAHHLPCGAQRPPRYRHIFDRFETTPKNVPT